MPFEDTIGALAKRADSLRDDLHTEEATKNALVMPFISALGYDVFNPREVIPEFTADVGIKKGEKVDYAIVQDGEVIMLFECKKAGDSLKEANMSQLFRYFSVTNARIAVLTNGLQYQFFSDLEQPNKMDARAFLELDLLDLRDSHIREVKRLSKESFDLDSMLDAATELKYTREIRAVLHQQFEEPDEEFVRFFFTKVNPGARFVASAREVFTPYVKKASAQYINERIENRLRSALERETVDTVPSKDAAEVEESAVSEEDNGIVTTQEELEGYQIVRAIVREVVDPTRVAHRDTKSYMGILLDDSNRKPICRLRFNHSQKYIGLFDVDKNETKQPIEVLEDIFRYADQLKATVAQYEQQ